MQAQQVPCGWRILSFPGISVTCTGTQELSLSGDEVNQQDNPGRASANSGNQHQDHKA